MSEELLGIIPARTDLHAIDRLKAEQVLVDKFGDEGLKLYLKVDGKRNAEEIRTSLVMQEPRFLEIMAFLEERGMITSKTVFEAEFESKG